VAPAFDQVAYRARNSIERAVGWLEQARRWRPERRNSRSILVFE
jgi:hypothetical protein